MPKKGLVIGGVLVLATFISAPYVGVFGFMAFSSVLCAQPANNILETITDVVTPDTTLVPIQSEVGNKLTFAQYQKDFTTEVQAEQKANAELIVTIGIQRGFSTRSIQIAIATAIQESDLRNLDHGDATSLGLFQQQNNWGTVAERLDPTTATNKFYDALEKIDGRDLQSMMEVAITVQSPKRSAYESRWKWDTVSAEIVNGRSGDPNSITPEGNVGCNASQVSGNTTGWVLPLDKGYRISSGFGMRLNPYTHKWRNHDGVDLAIGEGTPIYAVHAGTVDYAGWNGSFGNYVEIDHGAGVVTGYGHMIGYADGIDEGVYVQPGQVIGYVGSTGGSTGNHLHYLVRVNSNFVDPIPFMRDLGLPLN